MVQTIDYAVMTHIFTNHQYQRHPVPIYCEFCALFWAVSLYETDEFYIDVVAPVNDAFQWDIFYAFLWHGHNLIYDQM